jgi:L-aminopeptidase/D-esterase-like protein
MSMAKTDAITDVPGVLVGHWTDEQAATGCTAVLYPDGAVASVDVRGGAPATRDTDLLRAGNLVERIHGVLLTGGSEFGLDAAGGVVRWLEERGYGFPVSTGRVPIVVAAVLFDLSLGRSDIRPNAESGYAACEAATADTVVMGSVGAGTGASVGKALSPEPRSVKGGLGTASERTASGITVGAIAAVNCFGEVVDPESGIVIAGPRGETPGTFADTIALLRERPPLPPLLASTEPNTTIAAVATDAVLTKDQARRLAVMAQAGLARAIRPAHTPVDGDAVFALATGTNQSEADLIQLGALAARAMERAIVRAVTHARGLHGVPSAREWYGPGT